LWRERWSKVGAVRGCLRLFDFLEIVASNASREESVLVPFLTLLSSRDFYKERTKLTAKIVVELLLS